MLSNNYIQCIIVLFFFFFDMGSSIIMRDFFHMENNNLTNITWEHAVNNRNILDRALKSNVNMLEADVQLGKLTNSTVQNLIPIMAHPPNNLSDLSLDQFLQQVHSFNSDNTVNRKGVKLDFKSIESFNEALNILKNYSEKMDYPLWINADILPGPGNSTAVPVNAANFLANRMLFKNATLSIGWTTEYNSSVTPATVSYTIDHIDSMLNITKNIIDQEITFPVRAVYVARSSTELKKLINTQKKSTLTIWSGANDDNIDVAKLRETILDIGTDKIYIDVPNDLLTKLNLNSAINSRALGVVPLILNVLLLLWNFS